MKLDGKGLHEVALYSYVASENVNAKEKEDLVKQIHERLSSYMSLNMAMCVIRGMIHDTLCVRLLGCSTWHEWLCVVCESEADRPRL